VIDGVFGIIRSQLNSPFHFVHVIKIIMFFKLGKLVTIISIEIIRA
jgi:hypothetical protein